MNFWGLLLLPEVILTNIIRNNLSKHIIQNVRTSLIKNFNYNFGIMKAKNIVEQNTINKKQFIN